MKKKGSTSDFIASRNEELRAAFFSRGHYSTSDTMMRQTVRTPSSRYWVEPERARDVISRMERDPECVDRMYAERRRMYADLFRKYTEIRRQNPGYTKIRAVSMAIYSGAPEFYLSPSRARAIIYN